MFRRLRETAPAVLVPLAWTVVAAAHLGWVTARTLLIAHLVMAAVLVAFAAASWREMAHGALRVWRAVLLVGLGLTLLGAATLWTAPSARALLGATAVGWMLLPAAGLWDTGRRARARSSVYLGGAALSAAGAAVYVGAVLAAAGAAAVVAGLALVGVGQTAGIVAAVPE